MKISVHSDLHFEHCDLEETMLTDTNFDVLVLAGDIGPVGYHLDACFSRIRKLVGRTKPILFVAGNHDYYGARWGNQANEAIEKVCNQYNIRWLNRTSIVIDDVKFSGATGWSTMNSVDGERSYMADMVVKNGIADFIAIKAFDFETMIEEGEKDREFLATTDTTTYDKNVFITHMSPMIELGNDRYQVSDITNYFCNNMVEIFYDQRPDLWIYGHTHGNIERDIYETRCVSNQRGYGKECARQYRPNYIVEI